MGQRLLILTHGAPGAGKSSFIKKLGLEYLTISPDKLRLLYSEPEYKNVDNHICMQISQKYNKQVWNLVFQLLKTRLQHSSDTILDACNFTQDYIARYKKLADLYGFQILVLDFSSIPLEVLISQNKQRLQYNRGLQYVPEQVIRNIYQKMEPVPKGIYTIDATQPGAEEKFGIFTHEVVNKRRKRKEQNYGTE